MHNMNRDKEEHNCPKHHVEKDAKKSFNHWKNLLLQALHSLCRKKGMMAYDCWFQRDYLKALAKSVTTTLGILYFYVLLKCNGHEQWLLTGSWCHALKLGGVICGLFFHALCSIKQILLRIIAGKIKGNSHPSPSDPNHISTSQNLFITIFNGVWVKLAWCQTTVDLVLHWPSSCSLQKHIYEYGHAHSRRSQNDPSKLQPVQASNSILPPNTKSLVE